MSERAVNASIRVVLVDDHTVMRAGTRRILEDEPDIVVIGEAGDGAEALRLTDELHPDVLAVDIGMPGMDGIRMCRALRQRSQSPRILILTGHDKEGYVRALHQLGVQGYLLKSAGPDELVRAIRSVHAGKEVFSTSIARFLRGDGEHDAPRLTRKERDMLLAVAQGRKNHEIATEQSITLNTVEFHMRNLFMKLGASSRADAVMRAQRFGWIDLPDTPE
ncbi:MAG TPA: response regulator transcription factor [Ktedonobacterales bacterium]|nr:response regulator transcription factor [Ktedonobacterales bacterium]